jgi:MerR family transcriptional regulator/heat shock protein HspR
VAQGPAVDDTPADDRGVYGISVAAELVGLPAATLRLYESRGLLEPVRTDGGTRRYSANDLVRLRRISEMLDTGVNLAGVGLLLDLQDENQRLLDQIDSGQTTTRRADGPPRTSSASDHGAHG